MSDGNQLCFREHWCNAYSLQVVEMEIICYGNPTSTNYWRGGKHVWEWEVLQLSFFPFCIFATFDLEF